MAIPAVSINVGDGRLGVVSAGSSVHVVMGISRSGTANVPSSFANQQDLITAFGGGAGQKEVGPAVEAAALAIARGARILFVKIAQNAAGTHGTLDDSEVTGTSVVTVDAGGATPVDDFDFVFEVLTGGTIGTAGTKFRVSLDGGTNFGPTIALGTANTYTVANVVTLDFGAGTLVAGGVARVRCNAPTYTAVELDAALDALALNSVKYRTLHVVGPLTAALGGVIDTALVSMAAKNKPRRWIGNTRMPNAGESDASYQTAMQAISDAYSTVRGQLCAGAVMQVSPVSGRQYRRPASFPIAAAQSVVSEEVDIADTTLGALTGAQILDLNGNPADGYHNEDSHPGLDDMRFTTVRTHVGLSGVYVTRPRLFSNEGSDFRLMPHGQVMDLSQEVSYQNQLFRLNQPIRVETETGNILEADAKEIEAGLTAALTAALLSKPKASGVSVTVDRTTNIISTGKLKVTGNIIPLGYIEQIEVDLSFQNPSIQQV